MCGPCGKSGNYWALVAFLENLSTNDKPAISQGLTDKNLIHSENGTSKTIKKTYDYTNTSGEKLYQILRYRLPNGGKSF